ncbi:MAG TPA: hypothetical protein VGE65_02150 [Sphingobium sp.]
MIVAIALGVAAPAAPTEVPIARAWLLLTAGGEQWCAFTDEAKARKAAATDRFDESEWVRLSYRGTRILGLVDSAQSEDAVTEDSYSFDALGRVTQVLRKGAYAGQPSISVTYVPDVKGALALTPTARTTAQREEKAKRETYFLDWPLYSTLAQMPFSKLIRTKPVISVTERCIKGPPRQIGED